MDIFFPKRWYFSSDMPIFCRCAKILQRGVPSFCSCRKYPLFDDQCLGNFPNFGAVSWEPIGAAD